MTQKHFNCPYCNGQLALKPMGIVEHSPHVPWEPTAAFENISQGPMSGPAGPVYGEWQKITPVGKLVPRDIMTILLDSTIVFGLVSSATGLIFHYAGQTWLIGPFTGLVVAGIRYLSLMSNTQSLLSIREVWASHQPEIQQPGQGQPERVVKVEIKEGKKFKYAYFGLAESKLIAFAEALLDGAKFTEAEAKKLGITQEELKTFREELINRGLAYWNNPAVPRMGVTLRHSAYTVLQGIIDSKQQQAAAI